MRLVLQRYATLFRLPIVAAAGIPKGDQMAGLQILDPPPANQKTEAGSRPATLEVRQLPSVCSADLNAGKQCLKIVIRHSCHEVLSLLSQRYTRPSCSR